MHAHDSLQCSPDVLIGTLIYLMTTYQRRPRQDVAQAISLHLDRLAQHAEIGDTVRQVARGLRAEWRLTAELGVLQGATLLSSATTLN